MRAISVLCVCLAVCTALARAEEAGILSKYGIESPELMMQNYLRDLAAKAFENRKEAFEALQSPGDIEAYQDRMREFMIAQLGGFPERTPLNPQVVGTSEHDGFRLEKIIFESRPHFYVTGVLYLPLSAGPHPAVLMPCGHSETGKTEEAYQRACMLLATNGIAAFSYDPIGQGERYQILRDDGAPRFGATLEHTMVGVPTILLGSSTANYRVWDGIRAIDYLVSRPDIDSSRIGCTGNSGGGTLTSYLMALDPRVACAAPSCYITSFDRLINTIGAQDAEQNIYGQIAFGLDHADYVSMRAPRPTLICAATKDFFDITGTWDSFRQAKRLYGHLGFAERVDLIETDGKHGFAKPLREGMARWMKRWLTGVDAPIYEPDFSIFSAKELQCSPAGQVLLIEGARSVRDINMEFEMKLGQRRHFAWRDAEPGESLERVREISGVPTLSEVQLGAHKRVGLEANQDFRVEQYVISPEKGIYLPLRLSIPSRLNGITRIIVDDEGAAMSTMEQNAMAQAGEVVVAVDLRGLGESAVPAGDRSGFEPYFGADWSEYFLAYMLGKSYVGMRAHDILVVRMFIEEHVPAEGRREVHLFALGEASVPALHAAALEPSLFTTVQLKKLTITWKEVVSADITKNQLVNAVHGALQVYDLTDLITSLPPGKLQILSRARVGE